MHILLTVYLFFSVILLPCYQVGRIPVSQEDTRPLPIPTELFRCQVGDFAAGNYNVSLMVAGGRAWANPVAVRGSNQWAVKT